MTRSTRRGGALLALALIGGQLVVGAPPAHALAVCGNITTSTTWTSSNNPVSITCDVIVYPGVTLTINPGVNVVVTPPSSLRVRGLLLSTGSSSQPVTFTTASSPTKWGGIFLETNLGGRGTISFTRIYEANVGTQVQCCWGANPPATILDSTYSNNFYGVQGYAGYNIEIRRSTFTSNTYGIDSADKRVYDSTFSYNGCGACGLSRTEIYSSSFSNNTTAISNYDVTVRNSQITNNSTGVQDLQAGATLTKNTITGNAVGIELGYYSYAAKTYNNIHSNSAYNVRRNNYPSNLTLENNWWGTTSLAAIDAGIHDGNDQAGHGFITYTPILTQAVTLDTTPPDTTITSAPSSLTNASSATFTFTSSDLPATFTCSMDGSAFTTCASPKAYSALADGSHTFRVQATDNDMNTDATPAAATFTVDTTPPDTTISAGPAGTTGALVSFSYSSTEPSATYLCSLDGATPTPCTSPISYGNLPHGGHVFRVASVDPAGNADPSPAERIWTVDALAPDVELLEPVAPGAYVNGTRVGAGTDTPVIAGPITVVASASDEGSGIASVGFLVDTVPVPPNDVTYDAQSDTYSFVFQGQLPGMHEVAAQAADQIGLIATDAISVIVVL